MLKYAVIPNKVKELTNGDGARNEIRVLQTSDPRSFSRAYGIRMTRLLCL